MSFLINFLLLMLSFALTKSMIELDLESDAVLSNSTINALDEVMVDHFKDESNRKVKVTVGMGTPLKNFSVILDLNYPFTWLPNDSKDHIFPYTNPYVYTSSSSYTNLTDLFDVSLNSMRIIGFMASDIISIKGKSVKLNWGYAMGTFAPIQADGMLSLTYKLPSQYDKKFSLMAMLLESKAISKNVFSLYLRNAAPLTSRLYLGDLHEDFNSKNLSGTCDLNQTDRDWSCQMTHVIIGRFASKTFQAGALEQNLTVHFNTSINHIMLPMKYAEHFKKKLPHSSYACNQFCYFTVSSRWNNPPIYFAFNKIAYRIDPNDLYTDKGSDFILNIYFSDNNTPSLGSPFLNSVHIAFDADNNKVHLAVRNSLDIVNLLSSGGGVEGGKKLNLYLIIGASCGAVVLIIIIVLIIYFVIRKKRNEEIPISSIDKAQLVNF